MMSNETTTPVSTADLILYLCRIAEAQRQFGDDNRLTLATIQLMAALHCPIQEGKS